MIHCTRRVHFCAGHRIWGHENKCAHLHGHNYVALFHAAAGTLDAMGRVIDFSVLKERLGGWIEEHWDHGFLLHQDDAAGRAALAGIEGQKLYLLDRNPTAENLALYLLEEVAPRQLEGLGVEVVKVTLWETENCFAEVSRPTTGDGAGG
ncbi:MAG: 6-carboxytetrahydropterin synthase [Acidobacteriota bacterium]